MCFERLTKRSCMDDLRKCHTQGATPAQSGDLPKALAGRAESRHIAFVGARRRQTSHPPYRVYGRAGVGGVWPGTNAGLPCDVIVTLALVNPGEVAVMTLVPE